MSEPFLAEIKVFGFNFAPYGWATCSGQLLPISQYTALFSLIGTFYGGDGKSTFQLPNLNGRVPMSTGQGPGLQLRSLGETGGVPTVTLLEGEMPTHNHRAKARSGRSDNAKIPANNIAIAESQNGFAYGPVEKEVNLSPNEIGFAGGSQPHNNLMPYQTLNYCIALQGVFPKRP